MTRVWRQENQLKHQYGRRRLSAARLMGYRETKLDCEEVLESCVFWRINLLVTPLYSLYIMVWGCITINYYTERNFQCIKVQRSHLGRRKTNDRKVNGWNTSSTFSRCSAPCNKAKSVNRYCIFAVNCDLIGRIKDLTAWSCQQLADSVTTQTVTLLRKKIQDKKPRTIQQLKDVVKTVWYKEITNEYIRKLNRLMPNRNNLKMACLGKRSKSRSCDIILYRFFFAESFGDGVMSIPVTFVLKL